MPHHDGLPRLPSTCVFVYMHTSQANPVEVQLTNRLRFSLHNTTRYIITLEIVFSVGITEFYNYLLYISFFTNKHQIDYSGIIKH